MNLATLSKRGTEFLGTEHAIMGGAMSWVSERNLVSALSNAGGFGVIACGAMTPELLTAEIAATKKLTNKPFGVNLITMHPQLDALIDICCKYNVSHVVLAGGLPKSSAITAIKNGGAKAICFAPALVIAKKLLRAGADALIIEGMEAGGHIGPVATSVLAQEILPHVHEVPVFVAGGIGRGEAIATYLTMGAAGVQLGTRFVCSQESIAHEKFKNLFIRSHARDAIPSTQVDPDFPVIPVRAITNKATNDFAHFQHRIIAQYRGGEITKEEAQLKIEHFWAGALRKAVIDGDVEHGSVMAGQSVGMVKKIQPVKEIIQELTTQAENYLLSQPARIGSAMTQPQEGACG
ncbi:MAG: nitronate monooxygenase [Alphaproteobacteria bacterium]|nr:nitronate monooxygenase [Alphaproteobacteria bacterium]